MGLAQKKCVACEGDVAPLNEVEANVLLKQVEGWALAADDKAITKTFTFDDFKAAVNFVNKITTIAEAEGHHPCLSVGWGKVKVDLTTHAIKGLSENDFILAAKIDTIQ